MAETTTFCRICEALCGLEATVEDDRIVELRPDKRHVATEGFACVKGVHQAELYGSPDRLLRPLRRDGDRVREAGWDDALGDIGGRIRQLIDEHGPHSVALYVGTAAGFSMLHPVFAQGFMEGVGSRNVFSSATQDCANKFAVARHLYGFPFTQPVPDLARTNCLVVVGANPAVSKWSFGQFPNPIAKLRAIEERGGRVWIVDPRRTETARAAGRHLFVRPGSDLFFYLAFLHEVARRGATKPDPRIEGLDEALALASEWSPERCSQVTGIAADDLRAVVDDYLGADGAALYCSTGVNMGGHGALCFWLQEVINAATGNLDRAGGTLVGEGIVDFARFGKRTGMFRQERTSRIGGFPSVNDALPGALLADEILTEGPERIRALIVTGGNPLLTMAGGGRLREALQKLDLLVTIDLFRNETGTLAHWILPAVSPLQRPDVPFAFPLLLGMQARPYLQATEAVVPPRGEQRDEASIYLDLAEAAGVGLFGSRGANLALRALRWLHRRLGGTGVPQRWLLSLLLRLGGEGSFGRLLRHPHGRARGGDPAGSFLGQRVVTDDGRVQLAPPALLAEAVAIEGVFAALQGEGGLKLITKRALHTHNSWTHNVPAFVKGRRDRNRLHVHPADAERLGLVDDAFADVSTTEATVRVQVQLDDDLMPGVVALGHGWGHQGAKGLSVASATAGVNVNLLAPAGPDSIERVSGMVRLTGLPVQVAPAAGPAAATWSGLPETG